MNELNYLQFYINTMINLINSSMEIDEKLKEVQIPVKPYMVNLRCPKCNDGFLESQGAVYTIFSEEPPIYHKCNNCDFSDFLIGISYPYIKYQEINE